MGTVRTSLLLILLCRTKIPDWLEAKLSVYCSQGVCVCVFWWQLCFTCAVSICCVSLISFKSIRHSHACHSLLFVVHPPLIPLKCCYNTMDSWRCETVVWINPFPLLSSSLVIVTGCYQLYSMITQFSAFRVLGAVRRKMKESKCPEKI